MLEDQATITNLVTRFTRPFRRGQNGQSVNKGGEAIRFPFSGWRDLRNLRDWQSSVARRMRGCLVSLTSMSRRRGVRKVSIRNSFNSSSIVNTIVDVGEHARA